MEHAGDKADRAVKIIQSGYHKKKKKKAKEEKSEQKVKAEVKAAATKKCSSGPREKEPREKKEDTKRPTSEGRDNHKDRRSIAKKTPALSRETSGDSRGKTTVDKVINRNLKTAPRIPPSREPAIAPLPRWPLQTSIE